MKATDGLVEHLRGSPGFALFAYDLARPYLQDTVLVSRFPTGASLERLREKYVRDSTSAGAVVEDLLETNVGSMRAVRLIVYDPEASLRTIAFLVTDSDAWWVLEYSASQEDFESMRAGFEASAQTFVTHPPSSPRVGQPNPSQAWAIFLRDDFSDASSGWVVSDDENSRTRYIDGTYEVFARRPKFGNFLSVHTSQSTHAVSAEVEAWKAGPQTPDAWLGVTCAATNQHFYVFAIDPNAHHYAVIRYASGQPVGLDFGDVPPGIMRRDESNTLRGNCVHSATDAATLLQFLVNHTQVATLKDKDGFTDFNGIGIYVSSFRGGTLARFDNAVVRIGSGPLEDLGGILVGR